jgi:hypothetical protein
MFNDDIHFTLLDWFLHDYILFARRTEYGNLDPVALGTEAVGVRDELHSYYLNRRRELTNYKDTKTKCRLYCCFIELIDWRYSLSCWYFRPSLVDCCPSNLLSGSPGLVHLPPPFLKSEYSKYRVCGGGGGVLETIFCRS